MNRIIGKYYEVTDNSCDISLDTLEWTALVQHKDGRYSPDLKEDGAEFKIISEPFNCKVKFIGETNIYTFIVVKSIKTGICYRVLYNKSNVYKRVCKKEYIFR